jgi:glycine/D-amino acid oxidase-like deaminating enzyme
MSRILVLGGGVIGLSMAMMLARQGHSVTILEHDSEPLPVSAEAAWRAWGKQGSLSSACRTISGKELLEMLA